MTEIPEKFDHTVVADLHGSDDAFLQTLFLLNAVDVRADWMQASASLTLLGDILADRNQQSLRIVQRIERLREQIEQAGGRLNVLAGNHDLDAFRYLKGFRLRFRSIELGVIQHAGLWELFRLVERREPGSDLELVEAPCSKKDWLDRLKDLAEAQPLLDYFKKLRLFHRFEDSQGTNLALHAPPTDLILDSLLQPDGQDLNLRFQGAIAECLAAPGVPLPSELTGTLDHFQCGEWSSCPPPSDPRWTKLREELGVKRIFCGHRMHKEAVRHAFGPVEVYALDRRYGMFPKSGYFQKALSAGVIDAQGDFHY